MNTQGAQEKLYGEIYDSIDRFVADYQLSRHEVIGCLEAVKLDFIHCKTTHSNQMPTPPFTDTLPSDAFRLMS